jgi:outer membrane protein assembly factor BamB
MSTLRSYLRGTLVLCLLAGAAMAADWPQLRGPNRDGVSRETGVLQSWPAGGPKVLWKAPMGEGFSHLAVAKGRLFTLYGMGSNDFAAAYDTASGRQLWKLALGPKYEDGQGNGPRSTPTVDGERVFVLTPTGRLAALNAADGKRLWQRDLRSELDAEPPQWGISTSPLVEGNLLLVDVGGSRGRSLVAFDKTNGKTVWTSQNEEAGYSAPIAITVGGVRQVVFFTGKALLAVAPKDGKLLWRVPWRTDWDVNAATPIFVPPDKLYVSSGYDTGAALLQIKATGGGAAAAEVWRSRKMKNQFSSSVLHGGHIYGFDNSVLKCIDAATGAEKWKEGGFGHGSLILAGGQLIVLSERGKLALVEATPAGYREKGSTQVLSGKCWTAPTLADGKLYLRNEENLLALQWTVAGDKPAAAKTSR